MTKPVIKSALSERERLARDIYVRLTETPGVQGRVAQQIAAMAFERADAFFIELAARKQTS